VLRGLPGQADVWADEKTACAVLVEERRLAVACLEWAGTGQLETATITRDAKGEWWMA